MNQPPSAEAKVSPLHEHAIPHLQSIVNKWAGAERDSTANDLAIGQAEFRGSIGMLLCHIPKGHTDIRDAIRQFALQLDMTGDEMVEKVCDHILEEKEKVELKEKMKAYAVGKQPPGLANDGSFDTPMGVRAKSIVDADGKILVVDNGTSLLIEET